MKKVFGVIFVCLAVMLVTAYWIFAFKYVAEKDSRRVCTNIQLSILDKDIAQFITTDMLTNWVVEVQPRTVGLPVNKINTDKIEQALRKKNLINTAQCYFTQEGVLHIEVSQRIPIIRVMSALGSYYIDSKSNVMPLSNNFTANLPIATGYIEREFACNKLFHFAQYINQSPFWNAQITQIIVSPNQEVVLIPRIGNQIIKMGTLDNYEKKLSYLYEFYRQVMPNAGWDKYKTISLKYNKQIICTLDKPILMQQNGDN